MDQHREKTKQDQAGFKPRHAKIADMLNADRPGSLGGGQRTRLRELLWQAGNRAIGRLLRRRSRGKPLDPATKMKMESSFGEDFRGVRLHEDPTAHEACAELGAKAFTVGEDVYVGRRTPNLESQTGKFLLGHEMAHVVHQRRTGTRRDERLSQNRDAFEKDAQRASSAVQAGKPAQVTASGAAPAVQRDEITEEDELRILDATKLKTAGPPAPSPMIAAAAPTTVKAAKPGAKPKFDVRKSIHDAAKAVTRGKQKPAYTKTSLPKKDDLSWLPKWMRPWFRKKPESVKKTPPRKSPIEEALEKHKNVAEALAQVRGKKEKYKERTIKTPKITFKSAWTGIKRFFHTIGRGFKWFFVRVGRGFRKIGKGIWWFMQRFPHLSAILIGGLVGSLIGLPFGAPLLGALIGGGTLGGLSIISRLIIWLVHGRKQKR